MVTDADGNVDECKEQKKKNATYWWCWPLTRIGCGDGGCEWHWTQMRMVVDVDGGGERR